RPDSQGREASRPASHAADEIRTGHQSANRQGSGHRNPADAPRPRRRGDRVNGASSSCGSVRIDRLDPWLARPEGTTDCAGEVTLAMKGANRPTRGRKLRSTGTKAGTRVAASDESQAALVTKLKAHARDLAKKLEARTHQLAEARDQQTATSEVLSVISSS